MPLSGKQELLIETLIRERNQQILKVELPQISQKEFETAITFTAVVRAQYLKAVVSMAHPEQLDAEGEHGAALFKKLSEKRVAYEEAVAALDAMRHAIDKGYITLDE